MSDTKMCAICRSRAGLEPTHLPGGWRCHDRVGCKRRQRETINAHLALAKIDDEVR